MNFNRKQFIDIIKSKQAYQIVIPFFLLLLGIGCYAPSFTEFLTFNPDASSRILTNLLTGFIAIPSTVLAIAAVLFAILQVTNRKISFVQLIFENSGIIPVIYWATLNSLTLVLLQLFGDTMNPYWLLRILTCLSYNLTILLASLFYTLYRTFRYLDYTNITDDYISNISRLIRNELVPASEELDHQQLRQRGKEVYSEVTDAIAKDDAVLINKYLKSFAYALSVNPSSNYITDFNTNLAGWIVKALRLRSRLLGPLIEFWRMQFTYKLTGTQNFRFDNIDNVPLIAYKQAEKEIPLRVAVIQVFSIRLKEMAQKQYYIAQDEEVLRNDANFDNLFPLLVEYSELLHYLVKHEDTHEIKFLLNDIRMTKEIFNRGSHFTTKTQIAVNRVRNQSEGTEISVSNLASYQTIKKIVREIDMIVIGNLSWLYFELGRKKITLTKTSHLKSILKLFHDYFRGDELIESVVYLYNNEDNRMLWDDWIWNGEERLSGSAYTIASISDLMSAGFTGILLRQQNLTIGRHNVPSLEDLRFIVERTRVQLAKLRLNPEEWPVIFEMTLDKFEARIAAIYQMLDRLENNIQDEHTAELARATVSQEKIQVFEDLMKQQWEESRDLSRVFEYFGAVEVNPAGNLVDSGDNVSLNKGKAMFVDGPLYNFIYGMEFGKRVNDGIAYRFEQIASEVVEDSEDPTIAEIFERGINALIAADRRATAIFVDFGLFYTHEISLNTTGKYSSINNHQNPYNFNIAGFYNNTIPIIPVQSYGFQDLIIVVQMPNGLVMQQRQNDDYYLKQLILEINAVDKERAEQQIAERLAADNHANVTAIELMASMEIHIHQIYDFKIAEPTAVKVYRANIENYGR